MPAKTTETTPLTLADLEAKAEALTDRKDEIIRHANVLRGMLGDQLLAGDRSATVTEKKIVSNDRELDRIDLEIQAIERAKTALREAQARARLVELKATMNAGADRADALIVQWLEQVDALEVTGAAIEAEIVGLAPTWRSLNPPPTDTGLVDRARPPQHPNNALKESLTSAPMVRVKGHEAKVAAEGKAALKAYAERYVAVKDEGGVTP
jgi:hypothetical protein